MKSLQNKLNLIKEGKGNKELFLKEARAMFPNVVTNALTFDQAIHNLTERGILSEGFIGISSNKPNNPDWFKIFNENVKADLKTVDKEVEELETKGYDYKDSKNLNNHSMESMLSGYYAEMLDPKNAQKTEEEIKEIVAKNLEKDPLYYMKDGAFGVKGIGYTDQAPGLKASDTDKMMPVKLNESKHSGEADLKIYKSELNMLNKIKATGEKHEKRKADLESKIADLEKKMTEGSYGSSDGDYEHDMEQEVRANEYYDKGLQAYTEGDMLTAEKYYAAALKAGSWLGWTEADLPFYSEMNHSLNEAKNKAMEKAVKELENKSELAKAEAKLKAVNELISELESKLSMTEGEGVAEMVDKKKVKELKKNIKFLEAKKKRYEKDKARMEGKYGKKEDKELMDEEKEAPKKMGYGEAVKEMLKSKGLKK